MRNGGANSTLSQIDRDARLWRKHLLELRSQNSRLKCWLFYLSVSGTKFDKPCTSSARHKLYLYFEVTCTRYGNDSMTCFYHTASYSPDNDTWVLFVCTLCTCDVVGLTSWPQPQECLREYNQHLGTYFSSPIPTPELLKLETHMGQD